MRPSSFCFKVSPLSGQSLSYSMKHILAFARTDWFASFKADFWSQSSTCSVSALRDF